MRSLDVLRTSLELKLRQLEIVALPACQRYSFSNIPNEVLRRIINAYQQQVSDSFSVGRHFDMGDLPFYFRWREDVRKLALVNRQFRNVIYSMPQCFSDFGY